MAVKEVLYAGIGIDAAALIFDAAHEFTPYYSAPDCLIMPALYEGLPNVAIEAQQGFASGDLPHALKGHYGMEGGVDA